MSLSSIQTNLTALINKAYSADTSSGTANTAVPSTTEAKGVEKEPAPKADTKTDTSASASAEVTLGQSGNTTEIYTAQGLLQQMRQIQLSNTMLLFGNTEEGNDDSSGLLGMMGNESDAEGESNNEDWTDTVNNPGKAAVMVEKAKNASIKTMLGG